MVRQFATPERKMFVKQFVARPVIVIMKSKNKPDFALTFTDAVARFGADLEEANLEEANLAQAYSRAGRAFQGQLEQTFVILNEKGRMAWQSKRDGWEEGAGLVDGPGRGGRGRGGRGGGRGGRGYRGGSRGGGRGRE